MPSPKLPSLAEGPAEGDAENDAASSEGYAASPAAARKNSLLPTPEALRYSLKGTPISPAAADASEEPSLRHRGGGSHSPAMCGRSAVSTSPSAASFEGDREAAAEFGGLFHRSVASGNFAHAAAGLACVLWA